jgi:hypothetical protein
MCPIRYPSNKCSKILVTISQSSVIEKRHGAMQKLFIKKDLKKMDTKVFEILKTMGT